VKNLVATRPELSQVKIEILRRGAGGAEPRRSAPQNEIIPSSGGFDIFVEVYCKGRDDFLSFLNDKLRQVPGVKRTQTFLILKMHRLSYRWGEAEIAESQRAEDAIPGAAGSRPNS